MYKFILSKYIHFGIKKKKARVCETSAAFWMAAFGWLPYGGCLYGMAACRVVCM